MKIYFLIYFQVYYEKSKLKNTNLLQKIIYFISKSMDLSKCIVKKDHKVKANLNKVKRYYQKYYAPLLQK